MWFIAGAAGFKQGLCKKWLCVAVNNGDSLLNALHFYGEAGSFSEEL